MGTIRPMTRNDPRRKKLPSAKYLKSKCEELRWVVEHPNQDGKIMLKTGVTVDRDPTLTLTTHVDGLTIGYRVTESSPLEINPFFDREIFLKVPGYKIKEISDEERAGIMTTLFDVFIDQQQGKAKIDILNDETIKITQRFAIAFFHKFQHATIQVPRGFING